MDEPVRLLDHNLLHLLFFFLHLFLGVIFTLLWITNSSLFSVMFTISVLASVAIQFGIAIWYSSQRSPINTPLFAFLPMVLFLLVNAMEIVFQLSPPLIISQYLTIFGTLASYPLFMYLAHPSQSSQYRNLLVATLLLLAIIPVLQAVYAEIAGTILFLVIALGFWLVVLLLGTSFISILNQQRRSSLAQDSIRIK